MRPLSLAHLFAAHIDQHVALGDFLAQALLGVIVPGGVRRKRRLDIRPRHQARPARTADRGAFHHQRLGAAENRALARLVGGLAMRFLEQARHCRRRKMRQAMLAAGMGDENRRGATGVRAGDEAVGEIDLGAEMAGEFRRRLLQLVVLLARADQHQLDVDVDRLRHQRHRRDRRERHARLLDLQPPAAQEAPQLLPHQRIGQHVAAGAASENRRAPAAGCRRGCARSRSSARRSRTGIRCCRTARGTAGCPRRSPAHRSARRCRPPG